MDGALRRAATSLTDPVAAAAELRQGLEQDEPLALVAFFCAPRYATPAFARAMAAAFDGVTLVGCTTAGEIGPKGYAQGTVSAVSFGASEFQAVAGLATGLDDFRMAEVTGVAAELGDRLLRAGRDLSER
ncbi:MAG: FIST N-terminal domain-containing protein, partial [Pseudomonadota bacterium]